MCPTSKLKGDSYMTTQTKTNWSVIGMLVAWALTLATFVWNTAVKDANYSARIDNIEEEIKELDSRLDTAESFRMEIRADLAEIKTDLLWIRKSLDEQRRP